VIQMVAIAQTHGLQHTGRSGERIHRDSPAARGSITPANQVDDIQRIDLLVG
jgi:hypothetical protein